MTCVGCEVAFANSIYHTSTMASILVVLSSSSNNSEIGTEVIIIISISGSPSIYLGYVAWTPLSTEFLFALVHSFLGERFDISTSASPV